MFFNLTLYIKYNFFLMERPPVGSDSYQHNVGQVIYCIIYNIAAITTYNKTYLLNIYIICICTLILKKLLYTFFYIKL